MGSLMYSDNDIDSLDYRMKNHVRRISINDLNILGYGLKQYVERYKTLFVYNEEEEKILNELDTFSDLLITRQYDKLIHDPRYMITTEDNHEDYI